jgi:hypothetical protein
MSRSVQRGVAFCRGIYGRACWRLVQAFQLLSVESLGPVTLTLLVAAVWALAFSRGIALCGLLAHHLNLD